MGKKPINAEIGKQFDTVADVYEDISNPYTTSRRYAEIAKHSSGRCLEVGAATGNVQLKKGQKQVFTDISFGMCAAASRRHKRVVCCDAQKLPFSSGSFDTVICSEVIYYLDNPESFLKEAFRVLRSKGRIVISAANQHMSIYDKLRKAARKIGIKQSYFDDKVSLFTRPGHLREMLEKSGFRIVAFRKLIPLPLAKLHNINILLEQTPIRHFGMFIFAVGEKP